MPCPTCSHTMENLGHNGLFHCPRCGTVVDSKSVYVPTLVEGLRRFLPTLGPRWAELAIQMGLVESVAREEDRKALTAECNL